ncbi:MAG TPA: hypothetical protein ENI73_10260 [Spirochaetes bacterium]|nr:hypothetical protein [Spirochaetota bacterium]
MDRTDKNNEWFEKWLKGHDLYDKDDKKAHKASEVTEYKPFKESPLKPDDFPSPVKETVKFYVEEEESLDQWLSKNEVFDKDYTLKEKETWMYPPENLHAVRIHSTIDLHRLTVRQALHILHQFIYDCHKRNDQVVKIIHGRGKHSLGGPKIKKAVIYWLNTEGKGFIRFFRSASNNHGGEGATIVWLQ